MEISKMSTTMLCNLIQNDTPQLSQHPSSGVCVAMIFQNWPRQNENTNSNIHANSQGNSRSTDNPGFKE